VGIRLLVRTRGQKEEDAMSEADQVRETFIAAVARGDVETIVGLYHPDAVMEAPEGRFEGKEQIEGYYRAQLSPMDAVLRVVAVHGEGDTLVGEWVMEATHARALGLPDGTVLPASGKRVTQRGADVASYQDGLIRTHRLYYDQLELLAELGLLPGGAEE
jgi:ketosteroid isomerase-like protein